MKTRYLLICDVYNHEDLRFINLLTLSDIVLEEKKDGRFEIIKGKDYGTFVKEENLLRIIKDNNIEQN
jgi:hypothetical protein